jgi:hypothetical protein
MEPDQPQHDRPAVCYRPAVFFDRFCLIAQETLWRVVKKCFIPIFFSLSSKLTA